MSSVWLTASAVRYMTCRLLRARASQGLSPSSSPSLRIWLPSAWLIERTMRELSPVCRGTMSILPDRSGRVVADAGEEHQRAAHLHLVAAGQLVRVIALAVDERAVGAVQIDQRERAAFARQLGVVAGDFLIVQLNGVRRLAADAQGIALQLELDPLVVAANDEQRRHDLHPWSVSQLSVVDMQAT